VVFRGNRGKTQFMLVKQKEEGDWEIPKVTVRKGESSVRAVIRMMGEQAGMTVRVLEEASRSTGNAVINGKSVSQKFYYYLMISKAGGLDAIGFHDFQWLEYGKVVKKVVLKKEKDVFRSAREVLKEWEKTHKNQQI